MKALCNCLVRLYPLFIGVFLIGFFGPPYGSGLYYGMCGDHEAEQQYLDRSISHLHLMRTNCDDPDLQGILDYTIRRYNRVGAWDVMFMPLGNPLAALFTPSDKAIGCNDPLCPGVTLDSCLLVGPPEEAALVLVHEAMHDYWPCWGHAYINAREKKLYELSRIVRNKPCG